MGIGGSLQNEELATTNIYTLYIMRGQRHHQFLLSLLPWKVGFQYPDLPSWIFIPILNIQGALVYTWQGSCAIVIRFVSVVQFVCKYSWEGGPPIQQPFLSSLYRFTYCIQVLMKGKEIQKSFPPQFGCVRLPILKIATYLHHKKKKKTSNQTHKTHRRLHHIVHQDSA